MHVTGEEFWDLGDARGEETKKQNTHSSDVDIYCTGT